MPQIPKRVVTLKLPEPFDCFRIRANVSYPRSLLSDGTLMRDIIGQLVVEHDIESEDGKPLPLGPELWDGITQDLGMAIWAAIQREVGQLPLASSASSRST